MKAFLGLCLLWWATTAQAADITFTRTRGQQWHKVGTLSSASDFAYLHAGTRRMTILIDWTAGAVNDQITWWAIAPDDTNARGITTTGVTELTAGAVNGGCNKNIAGTADGPFCLVRLLSPLYKVMLDVVTCTACAADIWVAYAE